MHSKNKLLKIYLLAAAFLSFNFLISFLSPLLIKNSSSFPYKQMLNQFHLPFFITSFANFDGAHYIRIAEIGYHNYEQAFFPLYPLTMHLLSFILGKNYLINGMLISIAFFFLGILFFYKYLNLIIKDKNSILWIMFFLFIFPTSFFFQSVYTEGLFFLLISLSFFLTETKRYYLGSMSGIFSSLTRISGVFLFFPILVKSFKKKKYMLLFSLFPFAGLLVYALFLHLNFNDWLLFYHAQSLFGANRSSAQIIFLPQVFYRYLRIFVSGPITVAYFVSIIEFFIFNLFFWVLIAELYKLIKNRLFFSGRLGLNLFSLSTIILPTFTGTFSSIPRYSLMAFSFFIILGESKSTYLKIFTAVLFIALHVILLALFAQGYFVG